MEIRTKEVLEFGKFQYRNEVANSECTKRVMNTSKEFDGLVPSRHLPHQGRTGPHRWQ